MSMNRVEMPEVLIQELLARRSDIIAYLRGIGDADLARMGRTPDAAVVQALGIAAADDTAEPGPLVTCLVSTSS